MTKKKFSLLALSATAIMALASCGENKDDGNLHTYNAYLSTSPTNWNVHNWQNADESYIQGFTEIGFYDTIMNATKDGYDFVCEMAEQFPIAVDPSEVPEDLADKFYSSTGSNAPKGAVWDVKLNKAATFDNGRAIKAKDYVDSMQRQLDPKYANFRADSYYNGNFVIANAEAYYKNGRMTMEPAYTYLMDATASSNGVIHKSNNKWYLNVCKPSTYAQSLFGNNSDDSVTFYTALKQRSDKASDAVELAAQRIYDANAYFAWKSEKEEWVNFRAQKAADWAEVTKPDQVKSTMLEGCPDILIQDFDNMEVYVRAHVDDSSWGDEHKDNMEKYSTNKLKADLQTFVEGMSSRQSNKGITSYMWEYPLFTMIKHDRINIDMSDVGIVALDDYTLRFYLAKAISSLNLKFALGGNWLVDTELYDRLSEDLGSNSWGTKYATNDAANYRSYGPYKLTNFVPGSSITIKRNENWYGYKDGKHEGQFVMDEINTRVIKDHNTAINEFMAGKLDDIDLTVDDMAKYGASGRRTTTYESYTQKISFNTNRAKLLSRQSNNVNKTILANTNFRKGLSLALDRKDFAAKATAGSKEFTGLLNDLYLANVATGEMYRNTPQGKSVYGAVYNHLGGSTIDEENGPALAESKAGYNPALAKEYVKKAIQEELASSAEGHLVDGNDIEIEFRVYDNEAANTKKMHANIQEAWKKVVEDASADLKLTNGITLSIKMVKDEDYYTTAKNGGYDMIFSTWGGAAINPYGLMQVYLEADFASTCEYGFKGHQNEVFLDIDVNGDGEIDQNSEHKTFDDWYKEMDSATYNEPELESYEEPADKSSDAHAEWAAWSRIHENKLRILAGTEAGIINRFEAIPVVARGTSSLTGFKVENGSSTYINLIGYGGIRFLKFNYKNAEWNQFVKSLNGKLSDTYATWID